MKNKPFQRVLLKLSGEMFKGERNYGIDPKFLDFLAQEIHDLKELNIEIGIVIGGGNIFRGLAASMNGMDRVTADYTGMLATIMNALALNDALKKIGLESRVQSALELKEVTEPFILEKTLHHFEKKRIVIFAGGTGNPYFTTDTTAALRAVEIKSEVILKATKVNGIYNEDPEKSKNAKQYKTLTYLDVINQKLKIMDTTALSLSMDNHIPIIVFNLNEKGNIKRAINKETIGTLIQ
ncbi:MAG: UMP kinase [bacterium]